jgi:predicted transposase YdaD
MEDINRPHDAFFKNRFSRPQTAKAFCRHYLPLSLAELSDIDRLEVVKESFTDQRLREHLADVLYRIPLRDGGALYIYILLEHKSYLDEWVSWQIARYLALVWAQARADGCDKLPAILPVVLYHGQEKWNLPDNFHALFDLHGGLEQLRPFVPEFRYHLCDLSRYNDAEIVGGPELEPALSVMKHIFQPDLQAHLGDIFSRAGDVQPHLESAEWVEVLVRYLLASKKVEGKTVATEMERALLKKQEGDIWLPIIDDWKLKGFLEGQEDGLQKGRLEGQQMFALSLLRHRFQELDEAAVARVKALNEKQLTALGVAAMDFKKPDDLARWLRRHAPKKAKG